MFTRRFPANGAFKVTESVGREAMLVVEVHGRRVTFVDPASFDFALAARARPSAQVVEWVNRQSREDLATELTFLRRLRRHLERQLADRAAGKMPDFQALREMVVGMLADEHGWQGIFASLQSTGLPTPFTDLAMVRFSEYLAGRELILSDGRRAAPPHSGASGAALSTPTELESEDPLVRTAEPLPVADRRPWETPLLMPQLSPQQGVADTPPGVRSLDEPGAPAGTRGAPPRGVEPLSAGVRAEGNGAEASIPFNAQNRADGSHVSSRIPWRLQPGRREEIRILRERALVLECAGVKISLCPEGSNSPGGEGYSFALKNGPNVIGRDPACDVVLHQEGNRVSRMHAIVEWLGDGVFAITDLSRNGTWYLGNSEPSSDGQIA